MKQIGELMGGLTKTPELNNYSAPSVINTIQGEDRDIISVKYASLRIGALSENELYDKSRELLLKIHAVTGWSIPANEFLVILVDQFSKKLKEDYKSLNTDEIEYAFRRNTGVKDWGKNMNLMLIDEVLQPYISKRTEVSAKEEMKDIPPQQLLTDQQLDDIVRKDIEDFYQRLRNGKVPTAIPNYYRDMLVKDGLLNDKQSLSSFFSQRLGRQIEHIYEKKE